jgi:plastocyanin
MRSQRVLVFAAAILALVSLGGHFSTQVARAAQTWNVLAGTDGDQIPGGGSLTANGFFPAVVTINAGDTVSWTFPSANAHGVAFDNGHLPPLDKQINPGPNPGEADLSSLFLPINADQINGVFNPSVQFGSGVLLDPPDDRQPFTLTFNSPGVFTYDCQVHGSAMQAWVIVQPAGSSLSETPAQATARGQAEIGAAFGGAAGALSPEAPPIGGAPLAVAGGATVFPVIAGVEPNNHVSALAFFPNSLTVHRGDTVTFTESDPVEIHTVTFLSDGPEPPFVDFRVQPAGPPLVIFPANIVGPVGGNTYTGSGYFNSGILNPGQSYAVTFNAPPGTYPFRCMLHGDAPQNMTGTLTIVP